jgi:A/G-specific adenine glycosylase
MKAVPMSKGRVDRRRHAAIHVSMVAASRAASKPQARDLLTWYDRHRRALPWRARPGEAPDPYRVWLSEIMLQQTTVAAVRPYFAAFLERFPTLETLAAAPLETVMQAWAGLGYYSRARNLHACARAVVDSHGGRFPDTEAELRRLPGIGAYTAGAIAAIAFDRPAAAVDGNVERVVSRLFLVEEPLPGAKRTIKTLTESLVPEDRPGDFAQALMDLGATICTPSRPACALCPWVEPCAARAAGLQESVPRKQAKAEGTLRRGAAFVAVREDDAILLRTRPPKGLLGGMAEPPTSAWTVDYDVTRADADAPLDAEWRRLAGVVRHTFTHFPLELTVFVGTAPLATAAPDAMRWTPRAALAEEALPNVMKKVLAHALDKHASSSGGAQAETRGPRDA